MKELQLRIEGMTCAHCARTVEKALASVPGAEKARVEYSARTGRVRVPDGVPEHELIATVVHAGYRASVHGVATVAPPEIRATSVRDDEPGQGGAGEFDLLAVGSGAAGMAAAIRGAELGARVGIVEGGAVGGTCVNVGCIPSKNLIAAAEHYHAARRGFPGVGPCEPDLDWRAVLGQKSALVEELRQAKYLDVLASYPEVTLLPGRARLLGGGRVRVGEVEHRARKVVVTTGTSPWLSLVPGLEEVDPVDSTTAMELKTLPESLVVLGSSAVGLELGQTFARFGARVVVVELLARLLPGEDPDVSDVLKQTLEREGLEIHTGVRPVRIDREGAQILVRAERDGTGLELRAERILVATGRRANTRDLGLEEAGIELHAKGFVQVDTAMRTSNPDVFAAGDVTGGPGFVYVAAAGGRTAAGNALTGAAEELDLRAVPRVTFTSPQVAAVGLSETEARAARGAVEVSRLGIENVPRALVNHEAEGFIKLVAEPGGGRLLGAHAVAPNAGELLGEATLAIRFGLTARDLVDTLHPYLTWVEGLKLAAQTFTIDVAKLSCCA